MINWEETPAAIWRRRKGYLRGVKKVDPIQLGSLVGIERQKNLLCDNTERFLTGLPANNALLWGARGTGKSALVKALLNNYKGRGLRLIQVDKDDLIDLPDIVDEIREQPFHYIIFCDDLSFESGENSYKPLKTVLEGSIEAAPANILLYATSNRRHLVPEQLRDNLDTQVTEREIHYGDAVEEKISLSDRFGLWVSFHAIGIQEYLAIVDSYFSNYKGDREELHNAAKLFAMTRGSRSGRTAKQFYNTYTEDLIRREPPQGLKN